MTQASSTYVTGSHSLKSGFQWRFGPYWRDYHANADLVQRYSSGLPDSVTVYNTPTHPSYQLNADMGFYVQDSWKIQRLTINPGIRFEYFNSQIDARSIEPGRFVGFRQFPEIAELPNWFNAAPRFSAVYDLTGDARPIEVQPEQSNLSTTRPISRRYVPQSDTRNWRDCDYLPGVHVLDSRAADQRRQHRQDNEIGPSNNSLFGAAPRVAPIRTSSASTTSSAWRGSTDHQIAVSASQYRQPEYLEWNRLLVTRRLRR
jgi:hypothetical protein